jgi:multiple sugar transport system ATP-binding protein
MAKVRLENVTKIYNKKVLAVDHVSLEIPDGEIVSLLGPSGCGKTTTMRMIAGFEDVESGRIYVDNKEVTTLPPQQRNMSMVFQFPIVYDTMTIYENIAIPLRSSGYAEDKIRPIVNEACANFGIEKNMIDRKAKKMSISDRQRISLAHSFAIERNVHILDEPFSAIDPKSRVHLTKYVRDIQQKTKRTCIFVTHSQSEALTLSDRIAVMKDGKVLQYGTPDEIYSRPNNRFVGWFLGNPGMNFINCKSKQKNGKLVLDAGPFIAMEGIPDQYGNKIKGERELILGIRPENIEIAREAKTGNIPGTCRFAEPLASRLLLNVELGKNTAVNVKVPMSLNVKVHDKVFVRFPKEQVMLFESTTGDAL